jgi:pimeloyl-ACP methyl ester carboxylesterase
VICPDLIGFGHSARSDDIRVLWADAQADGVLALLDDLEVTRALVVGHDFGGPVAAHLMAKAPSRFAGLVLASTNTFGDTPIPFPLSGILWPGIGGIWARMLFSAPSLRMMVRQGVGTNAPRLDPSVYVGDRGQVEAIRAIFSTALRELAKRYQPITDTLQGVHVPTRVVWGDRDPFFPLAQAERTAGLIEGATVTVLAGAGHFLPAERPTELADTIAALWRTIDA